MGSPCKACGKNCMSNCVAWRNWFRLEWQKIQEAAKRLKEGKA